MMKRVALLTAFSSLIYAKSGAELTQRHCASCHLLTTPTPDMIPNMTAPAMEAVLFHVKLDKKDKATSKAFILDYTQNPLASKSVCESQKVQKFGVMPSLKGKVSEQELAAIADYLYDTYPTPEFVMMIKEIQKNDELNGLKNSPFLINSDNLPHLTKLLIMNWDKEKLGLTPQQKEKLLIIRKETIDTVANIKQKVQELEAGIAEIVVDEEEVSTAQSKVNELAKFKAEATMIHLKCLSESLEVLDEKQVEFLMPFWGL